MSFKLLKNLLYYLDLFKFGFNFQFSKGQKKFTTPFGLIFSFIVFAVLIFFFITSDMIQKRNPTVISQSFPTTSSPPITLNKNSFNIVFGMFSNTQQSVALDPSYVGIRVSGIEFLKNEQDWQYTNISYHLCTEQDLSSDDEEAFSLIGINISYCLDFDYEYTIGGGYFDSNTTELQLELILCQNDTNMTTCKSEDEIQTFLSDKMFVLYYKNYYIDFNNYENPVPSFPQVEQVALSAYTQTTNEIYLVKGEMTDDDSAILSSPKNYEFFSKDSQTITSLARSFTDNTAIAEYFFYSSVNFRQSSRSYQKLPDVLAKLSGIANLMIISGFIILNFYNQIILNLFFMKKVLDKIK